MPLIPMSGNNFLSLPFTVARGHRSHLYFLPHFLACLTITQQAFASNRIDESR